MPRGTRRATQRPSPLSTTTTTKTTSSTSALPSTPQVLAASPTSPLSPISPWPPITPPSTSTTLAKASPSSNYAADSPSTLPSAKEVYGSIAVLLTYISFAAYLTWALAPASVLERVGWTWFPAQEWAIIVPCWLMLLVLLAYWSYAGLTSFLTPSFDSIELITDSRSRISAYQQSTNNEKYYHALARTSGLPEAIDLPIDVVNRVLYPPRSRKGR